MMEQNCYREVSQEISRLCSLPYSQEPAFDALPYPAKSGQNSRRI
jgi:hypothetical protein